MISAGLLPGRRATLANWTVGKLGGLNPATNAPSTALKVGLPGEKSKSGVLTALPGNVPGKKSSNATRPLPSYWTWATPPPSSPQIAKDPSYGGGYLAATSA